MAVTHDQAFATEQPSDKLTLLPLTALVVGSMIGGGVFNLPSDMSRGASPGAILIGWIITGIGMLMLALVYQSLANRSSRQSHGARLPRGADQLLHSDGISRLPRQSADYRASGGSERSAAR